MLVTLADGRQVEWGGSSWAQQNNLVALEAMANFNSPTTAAQNFITANLGYPINWSIVPFQEAWNEFVRRTQDNGSDGFSVFQAIAASVGFQLGAVTGADTAQTLADGGSVSDVNLARDLTVDAAGLLAGSVISSVTAATALGGGELVSTEEALSIAAAENSGAIALGESVPLMGLETVGTVSTAEALAIAAAENSGAIALADAAVFDIGVTETLLGTSVTAAIYDTAAATAIAENSGAVVAGDLLLPTATVAASGGIAGWLSSAAETLGIASLGGSLAQKATDKLYSEVVSGLRGGSPTPPAKSGIAGSIYPSFGSGGGGLGGSGGGGDSGGFSTMVTPLIIGGVIALLGFIAFAIFRR
jgi:hypothetical protein